jgi:hypothetical protein
MIRSILCAAMLIGAFALGGCIAVGGTTNQPTRGQELIDLKTALDRGAITQADYDATKTQIVNRR